MDSIIAEQQRITAIPRKFSSYIKDIWYLQLKLNDRLKNNPNKIIKHPRFRAGYDFLLIREKASKDKSDLGKWWTSFQHADAKSKEKMIGKVRKIAEGDLCCCRTGAERHNLRIRCFLQFGSKPARRVLQNCSENEGE